MPVLREKKPLARMRETLPQERPVAMLAAMSGADPTRVACRGKHRTKR
ncbi:MAG: hypothetical protein QOD65_4034 [Gaiellales bacterium]|jgi:hypothetical protein|nr:hypothetical protein [Gaiellales bacterium]